jgi:hypothetical protein
MDGSLTLKNKVNLLNLVKESMDTKEVPVIILQVDDPDENELVLSQKSLEGRRDIHSRLSETALHKVLEAGSQTSVLFGQVSPALFRSQRVHAFIRQSVADES